MTYDLVVRGARVDGGVADIGVAGERIAAIGPGLEAAESLDAGGRLALPAFVQPHIHLDTGVMVATNPPTNLMLQGRGDAEPRRRGIPRIKELLAAGVTVAAGQDCVDDAFYPFGNADPLQVALIVAHAAQLGTPDEIAAALRMVTTDAARLLRLPDYGLMPGARADLVVIDAQSERDALREQSPRRWVLRGGRVVAET